MRDFSVSICKRCGERPCRIDCLDTYSRANGKHPNSVTPPTVEELRKRRAPAAVKAAMQWVGIREDIRGLIGALQYASEASSQMRMDAISLAIDTKWTAAHQCMETLEDIGRELDE